VIWVGDVGGTTTDLALLDDQLAFREIRSFASREHASPSDIVREFLRGHASFAPCDDLETDLLRFPVRGIVSDRVALVGAARAVVSTRTSGIARPAAAEH
jgi:glucokinase